MDSDLQRLLEDLKTLRKDVRAVRTERVTKKGLRERAQEIGRRWHREFAPQLKTNSSLTPEALKQYSDGFSHLIKLSAPSNRVKSYVQVVDTLVRSFRDDLVIPSQKGTLLSAASTAFDNFFSSIKSPDEVVLGWSAAIDRIHRRIETLGFDKFNSTSALMASQKTGRFKKFNQAQNLNSLSELRGVFDNVILWIVEGMGLIDSNQHTRLRSCFEMRCQSAHPGEAPITEFNLMSFFSDLDQIVLSNPNFAA